MATKTEEPEIQLTPQQMEEANEQAMSRLRVSRDNVEAQLRIEWERYLEAKAIGNHKRTIEALKMWRFIYRMRQIANRFVVALERIQSIQFLYDILQDTGDLFEKLMCFDNHAIMLDMKKNLKAFKKKLKGYNRNITGITKQLDNLFAKKPNIFVRFFNWITRKKDKTDAEKLAEMEAASYEDFKAYQASCAETVEEKKDEDGAVGPDAPLGNDI